MKDMECRTPLSFKEESMVKYILMKIKGEDFEKEALLLGEVNGLKIIESLAPKALLVEVDDQAIAQVKASFHSWIVEEEINYPKPGPHRPDIES